MRYLFAVSWALLIVGGCTTFQIQDPQGFAVEQTEGVYRAVSPEGVQMRIRTDDAVPKQSAEFWHEAMIHQLTKKGYQPLSFHESFEIDGYTGWIIEWGVPYGEKDYIYMTAFVPYGEKVLIVEAAGEHTLYSLHREALYESVKSLQLR